MCLPSSTSRINMKTKPLMTLEDAKRMAAAAEAEALRHQWNVVIAICDDGGHLVLLHRIDGGRTDLLNDCAREGARRRTRQTRNKVVRRHDQSGPDCILVGAARRHARRRRADSRRRPRRRRHRRLGCQIERRRTDCKGRNRCVVTLTSPGLRPPAGRARCRSMQSTASR